MGRKLKLGSVFDPLKTPCAWPSAAVMPVQALVAPAHPIKVDSTLGPNATSVNSTSEYCSKPSF
eukprot:1591416-Amphidinium_carterae.1